MEAAEFKDRLAKDEGFATAVAEHLGDSDKAREKIFGAMKSDDELMAQVVDRAKGELELDQLSVESSAEPEYDREQAHKDFEILAKAQFNNTDPAEIARKAGEEPSQVAKSTDETDFSSAGLAIPTPLAEEIVPILDSEPAFLEAGANIMSLPEGKMEVGRQNQDPTANWQGENETVSKSDIDNDLLTLTPNKLTVGHVFSNDFLRRQNRIIGEDFVMSRMLKVARNKLDTTLLEGGGGNNEPTGLITQMDSAHVNTSNGNTISNIAKDFKKQKRLLAEDDVPEQSRVWMMHPTVEIDLLFDINSNEDTFPFREELAEQGTMFGDPVVTTTNIDLDGSNDSNIYYIEMSEQLVGRATNFEMATSPHENFSQDQTVLRLVSHWDYVMMHTESASVTEDYTLQ